MNVQTPKTKQPKAATKTMFSDLSPKSTEEMHDIRGTNYFPECRKDANCNCKMCLDSISATLDLMSMSVQRSSLTKISSSKPVADKTPVLIDPTLLSTPISRTPPVVKFPSTSLKTALQSTAKTGFSKKVEIKKRKFGTWLMFCKWVLFLGLIFGLEFGISWEILGVLRPNLSVKIVKDAVVESSGVENVSERLNLIQKNLNMSVNGQLSSCVLGDSTWKVNQWPEGRMIYVVREANNSWILRKWSASVVQFEPNTWIIEYKRNALLENQSILLVAVEFFKFRTLKIMQRMKQHLWYLHDFKYHIASTSEATDISIPT
ncbi:uncharacterized protein LOC104906675 isoform X2 [Beta vulgaris subsp. vulgaris]|uniref:uncharacterized protein LOC104906675 isoform X2 n=1 Tax=Beta vulgaris subsp. vulgaris TaxID=3555 RepID=UPI000900600B|nr:uncharacterized protein LOC104906675 isoform X2 [Beta vulgaris subsp. vulgaris]